MANVVHTPSSIMHTSAVAIDKKAQRSLEPIVIVLRTPVLGLQDKTKSRSQLIVMVFRTPSSSMFVYADLFPALSYSKRYSHTLSSEIRAAAYYLSNDIRSRST
jgi:hypothetical protein